VNTDVIASPTPHTQVTGVDVSQGGLRLRVFGQRWKLTREESGALIAKGACATLAGAVFAGTMEARLYVPIFNMRLPHVRMPGR
jgi:hypothetical protein